MYKIVFLYIFYSGHTSLYLGEVQSIKYGFVPYLRCHLVITVFILIDVGDFQHSETIQKFIDPSGDGYTCIILGLIVSQIRLTYSFVVILELENQFTCKNQNKIRYVLAFTVHSFDQLCQEFEIKDNHLANMAWWLKSAGALNFELLQDQCARLL